MNSRNIIRLKSILVQGVIFVIFSGAVGSSFADEISIPGTSVSLDAPNGFTVSSSFSGLENLQDGSSITITELPAEGYAQLLAIFSNLNAAVEGFGQRGILIERTAAYTVGEQQIPVLIGSQPVPGGEVGKYLALFRGDMTVLLTFNVLDSHILTAPVVETAIRSVRLAPAATLEQKVAQLPFSFEVAAPFRIGVVLLGSTVLLPTFEGVDPTGLKPIVIVARALTAIPLSSNADLVSQQLLRGTQGFEGAEIITAEETEFGGGPGTYLEATAVDRKIIQFVRIPPDGMYVRLVAFGETAALDRVMSAVSEIARSVSIR